MRARDFVREDRSYRRRGKLHPNHDAAIPGALTSPDMDRYYDLYRAGMLMGRSPGDLHKVDASSWLDNRAYFGYLTPVEKEKVQQAFRELGLSTEQLVADGSRECEDTNIQSPVRPFQGYPR